MLSGFPNDVNNSIAFGDVYAPMLDQPMDIGVPARFSQTALTNETLADGEQLSNNTLTATVSSNGFLGKPTTWWVGLLAVFGIMVFAARKYGSGDKFANILPSVYNLFFLTIFIVLMLNLLKVIAAQWKIPGFSSLILAA